MLLAVFMNIIRPSHEVKPTTTTIVKETAACPPKEPCICEPCQPTSQSLGPVYKVPNIVHYTWYVNHHFPMHFKHYIGVLSASKILKPDKIIIHMNITRPPGDYFDKIAALPNVEIRNDGLPRGMFDRAIVPKESQYPQDWSDIARLKYLMQDGGIYLDFDVFVVRPFDELRKYEFVLGMEQEKNLSYDLLSNGIIISASDAPFLLLWAQSYEDDYRPEKWVYNSCFKPTLLWKRFPHLIHVERDTMHRPNWREINKIWGNETFNWHEQYAVHTYYRFRSKPEWYKERYGDLSPDENDIVDMQNTYAEIARYILSL